MNTSLLPPQRSAATDADNQDSSHHSTRLRLRTLQLLAFCLTTAGGLTIAPLPGQAAESQMEAEAALHLVCTKEAEHFICNPAANQPAPNVEENAVKARVTATLVPQFFTPTAQAAIADVLLGVTYLLPVGLGLGIFLYDRYAHYRASLLQQQINSLEQIWQRHTTQ